MLCEELEAIRLANEVRVVAPERPGKDEDVVAPAAVGLAVIVASE